jgi:hypothetical protein
MRTPRPNLGGDQTPILSVSSDPHSQTDAITFTNKVGTVPKRVLSEYVIESSPYDDNGSGRSRWNAEDGEEVFDKLRRLLEAKGTQNFRQGASYDSYCNDELTSSSSIHVDSELATILGGRQNAEIMTRVYSQIDSSWMCYSSAWTTPEGPNGSKRKDPFTTEIRTSTGTGEKGSNAIDNFSYIQTLPKELLLLCLRPERIARAQDTVLRSIITDLNCQGFVLTALVDLGLADKFVNLRAAADSPYCFLKARTACFKCIVFVARSVCALQLLGQWKKHDTVVEPSLLKKIHACLTILNEQVRVEPVIASAFLLNEKNPGDKNDQVASSSQPVNANDNPHSPELVTRDSYQIPRKKRPAIMHVSDTTESSNASREESETGTQDSKGSSISTTTSEVARLCSVDSSSPSANGDQVVLGEQNEQVCNVISDPDWKTQHERLGESMSQIKQNLQIDPAVFRAQWKEEMRQEMLQEMRDGVTNKRKRKHRRKSWNTKCTESICPTDGPSW